MEVNSLQKQFRKNPLAIQWPTKPCIQHTFNGIKHYSTSVHILYFALTLPQIQFEHVGSFLAEKAPERETRPRGGHRQGGPLVS